MKKTYYNWDSLYKVVKHIDKQSRFEFRKVYSKWFGLVKIKNVYLKPLEWVGPLEHYTLYTKEEVLNLDKNLFTRGDKILVKPHCELYFTGGGVSVEYFETEEKLHEYCDILLCDFIKIDYEI